MRLVAGPERVTANAFEKLKRQADQFDTLAANPLLTQLETILQLEAMLSSLTIDD